MNRLFVISGPSAVGKNTVIDGVKKMLEIGGAKDSQIESISYGEEKPEATGHDKASWAKNRRTDFKYH